MIRRTPPQRRAAETFDKRFWNPARENARRPPLTRKKVPAILARIAEWYPQAFVPETS